MTQPILLPAADYVRDLTAAIHTARTRIAITSLIIDDDPSTQQLITAVADAAQRGVAVDIAADSFTFSEFGGHLNPLKQIHPKSRATRRFSERLTQAGVSFTWLDDRFKPNPFAGVTHCKWSVVDDICYVFGGVNLYHHGIASADYMFKIDDATLADQLVEQQRAICASPLSPYPGVTAQHALGTWYIDSGHPGDSVIYDRAVDLARRAASVIYVSQYSPSGPLAAILKPKTQFYFNQPHNTGLLTSLMLRADRLQTGIRSRYHHDTYLHAKYILFSMPDSTTVALTGSHNFSYKGVTFGTREIALETTNPTVIRQLQTYFTDTIA